MLYWPSALPFLSCPLTLIGQQDEEHTSLPAAHSTSLLPRNAKTQCVCACVCHYQFCLGHLLWKMLGLQKQKESDDRLFFVLPRQTLKLPSSPPDLTGLHGPSLRPVGLAEALIPLRDKSFFHCSCRRKSVLTQHKQ